MGAPLDGFGRRGVAVLASGVVISLTALTTGLSPAVAQPDSDDVVTTTVVPEPEYTAPEPDETAEQTATVPEPVVPEAPQTQAPQIQAPQSQAPAAEPEPAPEPAPADEPEPQTQAPAPKTSTVVQTAEPSTPAAEPSTATEPSPEATAGPGTATKAPESPSVARDADEPTSSTAPSAALTSGTAEKPAPSGTETSASPTAEDSGESETPTVSIEQAAKEIETQTPETLEAPAEDIQLAKNAKPIVEEEPAPAPEQDVAAFSSSIENTLKIPGLDAGVSAKSEVGVEGADVELVSNVRQWRPDWIEYDEFYRPVILNPFRAPVRLVYMYEMAPRIVFIPPLARIVLQAAQFAAYSFTAAVLAPINALNAAIDTVQALTNIAVGSFFGGGFFPGVGLPLPPPPPPVLRYDNVPVLVNYSNARYEPFRVRQIVDVGDDRIYGARKVLLDGATPVWGEWTQTASGERQFEVHKTQQFPGLSEPAEAPLPGDYRLRLAADESSTGGLTGRDIFLMVAAGVIGTLGFGAIGLAFFLGRRRTEV
ncbi:hypothetical protein ABGB19_24475 [Mycobacterium sp. B14F4]|uniref:hypothetical protein n=1 Tax=Mycobacterium sp. B14F4 TaxID=3153565 RepID=UPI00325CB027